jgi:hypothetical protein
MHKGVLAEGAEAPGNVTAPSRGLRGLTVSGDDFRAFLALCLAACLLSVYTIACATGVVSM